jgi:hypothetical protein
MAKSNPVTDAFNRLAAAAERFLASEFLSPVIRGSQVLVRIAGVICAMRIQPADFEGWGVFRPSSHSNATLVRKTKLAERQCYLELFPLVRLILSDRCEEQWLALPAHRADSRFQIEGTIPIQLVEEAQLFDVIEARFDGTRFWFAGPDSRWDPGMASYLRNEIGSLTPPEKLQRAGLTSEERTAYALNYWPRYEATEETRQTREERRLRRALEHAGAELKDYVDRHDVYTVTYEWTVSGMSQPSRRRICQYRLPAFV